MSQETRSSRPPRGAEASSLGRSVRAAVDLSPTALVLVDAAGRVEHANAEAEALTGYALAELVGRPLDELFVRRGSDAPVRSRAAQVLKGGPARARKNMQLARKDGVSCRVDVSLAPSPGASGTCFLVALVDASDRTIAEAERRGLEEALRHAQKSETVGALAAGVVHDVNNVLSVLAAHVELALARLDGVTGAAGACEELVEATRAVEQARELSQRLLAYSRRAPLAKMPTQLGDVVRDTVRIVRASLPRDVALRARVAEGLPRVSADAVGVQQVLLNLVLNAAHALPQGGAIDVELDVEFEGERGVVVLTVRDDGHGMDEAVLARACEPFFSTKAPGEGTGLGLAVGRCVLTDHGGALELSSRVGEGTQVRCIFPALAEPRLAPSLRASGTYQTRRQRVLVVDDDDRLARVTARLLDRAGFEAQPASPGDVPDHLEGAPYDAVVTDLTMPGVDGLAVARRARARWPRVGVVLSTGRADDLDAAEIAEARIDVVVAKPLTTPALATSVLEAIARNRAGTIAS